MGRLLLLTVALLQLIAPLAVLAADDQKSRFEAGPVFTATTLSYVFDYKLRLAGGRFVWNATPRFSVEGSMLTNFSIPNTVTARDGGRALSVELGPKLDIWRLKSLTVFVKSEAGFLSYSRTLRGIIAPDFHVVSERKIYPAIDFGGGVQVTVNHHLNLRGDFSDLLIFYREANVQDDLAGVNSVLPSYSQHVGAISAGILLRF